MVFLIENWTETEDISKQFIKMFPYDSEKMNPSYKFESLFLQWLEGKQANGLLSIISVLVGIVFFCVCDQLFVLPSIYRSRSRQTTV